MEWYKLCSFHSSLSVNDDKFHHISATKNGSLLSLYIDGVLQSTATDLSSGQTDNPDPLHIGGELCQRHCLLTD